MKNILVYLINIIFWLSPIAGFGQFKAVPEGSTSRPEMLEPVVIPKPAVPNKNLNIPAFTPHEMGYLSIIPKGLEVVSRDNNGMPAFLKGTPESIIGANSRHELISDYLSEIASLYRIKNVKEEVHVISEETDDIGMQHFYCKEFFNGIEVYGGEFIIHLQNDRILSANGRLFPTPEKQLEFVIGQDELWGIIEKYEGKTIGAIDRKHLDRFGMEQIEINPVIYHESWNANEVMAVYHVKFYLDLIRPKEYIIHAETGEIIMAFDAFCGFYIAMESGHDHNCLPPDGPAVATAQDLFNINRTINTYEAGNSFYMIDASRSMFNNTLSNMPDEPVGVIWTIDAFNTSPVNSNFNYDHVTSSNNSWSNKTAVSAHFNAGKAYNYYKSTHGRESINGSGGNIVSIINVAESNGSGMDNAFWNGAAMFYGNGASAFEPLAKGLDVAGHELSHGVIQSTANLEYQGESGAINESFADIFGAMIDREDWKIGEDVVKSSAFPSGALRDMEDPHNGGNQLGDPGWQPKHTNEKYTGSQDNGGVHINSGIPNHAFFLFAEQISKETAEKVFYRALTKYLTKSSKFVDLRNAVIQSAQDIANNTVVQAAASAFDAVGILGGSGGNYENDLEENPGDELILFTGTDFNGLKIVNDQLQIVSNQLSTTQLNSKPSVTDDGSEIVFIGSDKKMHYIFIDWDQGQANESIIQNQAIWRSVVISKDGNRVAAITDELDNIISVFDFGLSQWHDYSLYNPTFSEGVITGDVDFADAMEFDFSGEWVMYDAQSTIPSNTSEDIIYWDIGFLNVFDETANSFTDGEIQKLFTQLPENTNIGNPSFSKKSPYIVAFDYIDPNKNLILGSNIETGDVGEIFQNSSLGYPSYSNDDTKLIFDNEWLFGIDIAIVDLASNKIQAADNPDIFIENARWGSWFSNGDRVLADVLKFEETENQFSIYPNPASDNLVLETDLQDSKEGAILILDMLGRAHFHQLYGFSQGKDILNIPITDLTPGQYVLKLRSEEKEWSRIFIKL